MSQNNSHPAPSTTEKLQTQANASNDVDVHVADLEIEQCGENDLRFFASQLLGDHFTSFHYSVLIAARGKLRRISGQNHIEDAFQDACVIAVSGRSKDLGARVKPLREMAESIAATSGQKAAFDTLEVVLGSGKNVPERLQGPRADARALIGHVATIVMNVARTPMRDERRHAEIIAANAGSILVFGANPGGGDGSNDCGEPCDTSDNPLDRVIRNQEIAEVRAVLAQLKPREAALLLQYGNGLSHKEIGEALGIYPPSVATMLARAKAAFSAQYQKRQRLVAIRQGLLLSNARMPG